MKWVEVNVKQPGNLSKTDFLVKGIKPLVKYAKTNIGIISWHFLWEGVPYPSTLRLRFLLDTEKAAPAKALIEACLKDFEFCFGAHGQPDKEYEGEASDWGVKGWEKGIEFLCYGSEFALELTENKNNIGAGNDFKKNSFFFADRYTHLFLNQLEPLLVEKDDIDEAHFEMCEGIFRYAVQYTDNKYKGKADASKIAEQIVKATIEATKKKAKEQVDALLAEK
jgi:hypothetical protein